MEYSQTYVEEVVLVVDEVASVDGPPSPLDVLMEVDELPSSLEVLIDDVDVGSGVGSVKGGSVGPVLVSVALVLLSEGPVLLSGVPVLLSGVPVLLSALVDDVGVGSGKGGSVKLLLPEVPVLLSEVPVLLSGTPLLGLGVGDTGGFSLETLLVLPVDVLVDRGLPLVMDEVGTTDPPLVGVELGPRMTTVNWMVKLTPTPICLAFTPAAAAVVAVTVTMMVAG